MSARTHATLLLLATVLGYGCVGESHDSSPVDPGLPLLGRPYDPVIPGEWADAVTNSYFPLVPGTTLEYLADTDEGVESITVEVLADVKVIQGVQATTVRDRVHVGGVLREDTFDWYAQDADGNVWYLGEATQEFLEDGSVSTEGSWEWGVDDALPGIIMWADPGAHLRDAYRQEYAEGEAEDWGKVLETDVTVEVPYGELHDCVETLDWNGLEPGSKEHKFYAPGIGVVLEIPKDEDERVELISVTP
ncbi:MAG: hypothetical protein ACRDGR_01815 [bacterium]